MNGDVDQMKPKRIIRAKVPVQGQRKTRNGRNMLNLTVGLKAKKVLPECGRL